MISHAINVYANTKGKTLILQAAVIHKFNVNGKKWKRTNCRAMSQYGTSHCETRPETEPVYLPGRLCDFILR